MTPMRFFTFASERLKPQITICNYATVFSSDTSTFFWFCPDAHTYSIILFQSDHKNLLGGGVARNMEHTYVANQVLIIS